MVRVLLHGYGRIGRTVETIIKKDRSLKIVGIIDKNNINDLEKFVPESDIIVDFSHSSALKNLLDIAISHRKRVLIGTTGFSKEQINMVNNAANYIAILLAPNTGFAANIIAYLSSILKRKIDYLNSSFSYDNHQYQEKKDEISDRSQYNIDIIDYHHRYKKDSPSGTSIMIKDEINSNDISSDSHKNTINIHSIRSGGIYGQHDIIFSDDNNIIKLSTSAINREAFAKDALLAIKWLNNYTKKKGVYSMKDVLNLY
ncbi:MAG TPA: dihydrodipicolinate reductase C-terminal domain-containing protein [Candidatus Megaira endosymbiont of Hartmannula sinica]|nr:dihydrodipicolinate reductase C-terminal domain-containing protein [Candidatus Megaera endosymbiont of Hartmannula sinica]